VATISVDEKSHKFFNLLLYPRSSAKSAATLIFLASFAVESLAFRLVASVKISGKFSL
jgi:hypothetical protein